MDCEKEQPHLSGATGPWAQGWSRAGTKTPTAQPSAAIVTPIRHYAGMVSVCASMASLVSELTPATGHPWAVGQSGPLPRGFTPQSGSLPTPVGHPRAMSRASSPIYDTSHNLVRFARTTHGEATPVLVPRSHIGRGRSSPRSSILGEPFKKNSKSKVGIG